MKNSDSDSENDCFESAEDSVDEEERNVCTKSKSKLLESGTKSSKPDVPDVSFSNTVSAAHQLNEDTAGTLLSYRKRPERAKRLPSKPSINSISKSTDELIFKTEKIIPDIFLQDITSNLSKNINRSLDTLQQTSSNVKEFIFNSIPVSSFNHNEEFSYDDKNLFSTSADIIQDCEHFKFMGNMGDNLKEKQENNNAETSTKEISFSSGDGQNMDSEGKKPVDIDSNNSDNNLNKVQDLKIKISNDIDEAESCTLTNKKIQKISDNAFLDSKYKSETKKHSNKIKTKTKTEVDNSEGFKIKCTNSQSEILEPHDQITKSKEINIMDSNKCSQNEKLQDIKSSTVDKHSVETTLNKEDKSKENSTEGVIISHSKFNESSNNCINLESHSENIEYSDHLEISAVKDSSNIGSKQLKSDSEYNLKELKTALKDIVKEDKSNSENINENFKNSEKVELIFEGKIVSQSSKEGWDDFDFSDLEDDSTLKQQDNISISLKGKEKVLDNQQTQNDSVLSFAESTDNQINTRENKSADYILRDGIVEKSLNNTSLQSLFHKSNDKNLIHKGSKIVKDNKINASKEIIDIKPLTEHAWDWDTWEETSEENVKTDEAESKNFKSSELQDVSDLSKWSGWENFGQKSEEKLENWKLGSWGVDMLLNKATAVTQGISNVLEAGLGAPDPETLARMEKIERENLDEKKNEIETEEQVLKVSKKNSLTNVNLFPVSGLTSLVAEVTSKIVEHSKIQEIGSKVISGGLDTLETFGKKTMEVLQEGDPGLKNKRAFLLGHNKPVLSQILREAQEKSDRELKKTEERESIKKCHFETLFDDFQGLVYLEALEMLSRQYELKLEQLRNGMKSEDQEELDAILEEVKQLCSFDECDMDLQVSSNLDFKIKLQRAIEPLKNEISIHKIIQIHEEVSNWLLASHEAKASFKTMNQKLISALAELAAAAVQQFHKSGELLSIKECRKTVEEVDALLRFTTVLCTEINKLCENFHLHFKEMNSKEDNYDATNPLSENVTIIMTNATFYIRQAFNLLIPVLQFGAAVY